MPGERGLHRHVGSLAVADFADHDDVGILPHQGAQAFGKAEVDGGLHLHLVERGLDHLDRVFHGADVHLLGSQALEGGIQRGGLAAASRPGDEDDAVGLMGQALPVARFVRRKAEGGHIAHDHVGIEDAHHEFFAKRRGHGGQAQLHLVARRSTGLDAAILRTALFDHVHAAEQLDPAGHRAHHRTGHLINRVQHTVDAKPDHPHVAPRLEVDVGGALLEGVLPQPIDHLHHAGVVGVERLAAAAQFHQLLELVNPAGAAVFLRMFDRAREVEKLHRVAGDVGRAGDPQFDGAAQHALHLGHPAAVERLAGGDGDRLGGGRHGQNAVALGVAGGHEIADLADLHLQRIDAQIRQIGTLRQPFGQHIQIERAAVAQTLEPGQRHALQRMQLAAGVSAALPAVAASSRVNQAVGLQPLQQFAPIESTLRRRRRTRCRSRLGRGGRVGRASGSAGNVHKNRV